MARCSNCGQKTEGDFCQWCGYPVMKGDQGGKVKTQGKPAEGRSAKRAEAKAKRKAEREAKEQAKRDAEEAKEREKREATEARKAKRAEGRAKKVAERGAKEQAKREAEEAKKVKRVRGRVESAPKKGEAEEQSKRQAEVKTGEAAGDGLYQGVVKLILVLPIGLRQMREMEEALHQVEGLHLEMIGGSVEGGTGITVSVENPIPLVDILKGMSSVAEVAEQGNDIRVVLKTE